MNLTTDGKGLYFSRFNNEIFEVGAFDPTITGLPNTRGLFANGSYLCAAITSSMQNNAIVRFDKTVFNQPASRATPMTVTINGPITFTVDARGVVFATADGNIQRVAGPNAAPSSVATMIDAVNALVTDADGVYWTTDTGAVGWARK